MSETDRQRIVRVPGSRRAQLTPVPGTDADAELPDVLEKQPAADAVASGPNDDRLRRDVPPHY